MHIVVARYAWQLIRRLPSKLGIGHTVLYYCIYYIQSCVGGQDHVQCIEIEDIM